MTVTRRLIGTNADGTPHYLYESDSENPHLVMTGPLVNGSVILSDGTPVDITPHVIEVDSPAQAKEVADLIADIHEQLGTFEADPADPSNNDNEDDS